MGKPYLSPSLQAGRISRIRKTYMKEQKGRESDKPDPGLSSLPPVRISCVHMLPFQSSRALQL